MSGNTLAVWSADRRAGSLQGGDRHIFAYAPDAEARDAVSLTMPVRLESWTSRDLHPIFQMNLPEGALLISVRNAIAKVAGTDDLTLLRVMGAGQLGRNRFSVPGATSPPPENAVESLEDILRYPDTEALFNELMRKYALSSGISGVQPKVILDACERATFHASSYIVKSWGPDYPHLAANELFCMAAAKRAGLPVPECRLSDDGRLFVMKRFDRTEDGTRLGFEDFCVLQGVGRDDKYKGSYEACARTIGSFVSPANLHAARRQFFGTLALSVIVRNGDAHLKNFGVLYTDAKTPDVRLAPTFDIVTTAAYLRNDVPALTLDGRKIWWNRKTLLSFATTRCMMPISESRQIIEQVCDAVNDTRPELESHLREHPDFAETGRTMLEEWDKGLTDL